MGRTLPTYRWFYNMEDIYQVWIDPVTLRSEYFQSDIREGDYTFERAVSTTCGRIRSCGPAGAAGSVRSPRRKCPSHPKAWTPYRSFQHAHGRGGRFQQGQTGIPADGAAGYGAHIRYRFLGREVKKIRNMGKFRTLKFDCQLGTTEGYSFTDGTVFYIWITDDKNKIPVYIESPVRVGSINGYISGYKNLKYPVTSLVK